MLSSPGGSSASSPGDCSRSVSSENFTLALLPVVELRELMFDVPYWYSSQLLGFLIGVLMMMVLVDIEMMDLQWTREHLGQRKEQEQVLGQKIKNSLVCPIWTG